MGAREPPTTAARRVPSDEAQAMMLEGKRIVVTGVLTNHSIAYAVADRAQQLGAEVVLTSFGRVRRMTERAAGTLSREVEVLEFDVTKPEHFQSLHDTLRERWGGVDGALHAIAHAPMDALGGAFMSAPGESATQAFQVSALSFRDLAQALRPLMRDGGGGLVALDFDASVAWPAYDWMGVAKAALESINRYLARDLGGEGIRANLVSAGPIQTPAASAFEGFAGLAGSWGERAPLAWDMRDAGPIADAVCFLLSDMARGISGEIVHVDGGVHAVGAY